MKYQLIKRVTTSYALLPATPGKPLSEIAAALPENLWSTSTAPVERTFPDQPADAALLSCLEESQPHVRIYYDPTYWAVGDANYDPETAAGLLKPTCQIYYIPYRLIQWFQSLSQAFTFVTHLSTIHLADYDAEAFYTDQGAPWPEEDYARFPGLEDRDDYLYS